MKKIKLFMIVFVISIMTFVLVSCVDSKDETAPTVSITTPTTANAGEEITISYTVSDDVTKVEDLVVEVTVVKDGQIIELNNNKFIALVGVYTVKVKVTDEALNSSSSVIDITVSEVKEDTPTPENPDTEKPVIEILNDNRALSGDVIKVDYLVTDNISNIENISVLVNVTLNNEEVSLEDNSFIAEAGKYEISVTATDEAGNTNTVTSSIEVEDVSYREGRDFSQYPMPDNNTNEDELPLIDTTAKQDVITLEDDTLAMIHGNYRLDFIKNSDKYVLQLVNINENTKTLAYTADNENVMFINNTPVMVYLQGSAEVFKVAYDEVIKTNYGVCATKTITSSAGTTIEVKDCYYFASQKELGAFNVRKTVRTSNVATADTGYASEYSFTTAHNSGMEWLVPNIVYKNYTGDSNIYRETQLGVPMIMMRNKTNGHTLSISRYQPIVTYQNNSYATLKLDNSNKEITVAYPSNEGNRKYHTASEGAQHVYDLTIRAEVTDSYELALPSVYNAHFNLQDQRIVDTDIDEVYKVICEDYKVFLHETEQEDELSGKKYTSYGLPWRITIEDGEFGPLTYQAGFIGQQIPSAYNMMLYGVMNDDLESLQNGINVIDFWVEDAEFMSVAGVPHIWYDTWDDGFRAYPCFLRMAVDAMEGLLDAYLLAEAHGLDKYLWYDALDSFGEFLIKNQNDDGSYYRCYNYSGGPFVNWDDGIEEPVGNICQSYSKANTPMAIRFLGKMYEFTGDDDYLDAALKAGQYTYDNLYEVGSYRGGTCDNPNATDKEAGVFAMYAYDTLYTLTGDEKWLDCLKQATAFTMSTVLIYSFGVKESHLKSGLPVYAGYTDGMSFISCYAGSGVDNYIAYIYYELFRVYILTGEETYLKQAEFIQQNTKSIMNWDDALGYKYKSLVAEASGISGFTYGSASDGAWVTWSSVANAEPIAKMYNNFGYADIAYYKNVDINILREQLNNVGCGGKAHTVYENTVIEKVE